MSEQPSAENDAGCGHPNHGNPDHDCAPFVSVENGADVAAVLGEHRICWRTLRLAVCTCGKWARPDEKGGSLGAPVRREHDAHVAQALLTRVRDDARRESEAAWDDGWNAAVDSDGFPGDVNPYRPIPPDEPRP